MADSGSELGFWGRVGSIFRSFFGADGDGLARQVESQVGASTLKALPATTHPGQGVILDPAYELPDNVDDSPMGIAVDPMLLGEQYGYRPRSGLLSHAFIDNVYYRLAPVSVVVQTRLGQLGRFFVPQKSRFETGFRVAMTEEHGVPTAADRKFMGQLEQILMRTGVTPDARLRPSFRDLGLRLMRDSLLYDAATLQIVSDPKTGKPSKWYAMDAKTIFLADTRKLVPEEDLDAPYAVQVWNGAPIAEFSLRQLAFGVRNPSTDLRLAGYGTPEIALLVQIVTGLLDAIGYNLAAFSQGSLQKGLLNIKGTMAPRKFQAFRKIWYTLLSGRANWWRPPLLNAEGVEWIPMTGSNRDMEFGQFVDFLLKLVCGVYLMDAVEVGFRFGSGGARQQMFAGADKGKINESKDKGLKPLLIFLADLFNRWIIWPIDPAFSLEFVGLDTMTPKERADLNTQRVRSIMTVNEVRAEEDLPPVEFGDRIFDPNYSLAVRDKMMQDQAELAAENLGMAGAEGGDLGMSAGLPDDIGLPTQRKVKLSSGETDGPAIPSDDVEPATGEMAEKSFAAFAPQERAILAASASREHGLSPEAWDEVLASLESLADENDDMDQLVEDLEHDLDSLDNSAGKGA